MIEFITEFLNEREEGLMLFQRQKRFGCERLRDQMFWEFSLSLSLTKRSDIIFSLESIPEKIGFIDLEEKRNKRQREWKRNFLALNQEENYKAFVSGMRTEKLESQDKTVRPWKKGFAPSTEKKNFRENFKIPKLLNDEISSCKKKTVLKFWIIFV